MIKHEVRQLGSQWLNGVAMYPGHWVLTWVKLPFMPWSLASITPYMPGSAPG